MRYLIYVSVLAAIAVVSAQDLSQLPTCAQTCFAGAIAQTSCSLTDFPCLCRDTAFQNTVTQCVQSSCNQADQASTVSLSSQQCASAGVSLSLPSATGSAVSAASSAVTSAASAVSSRVSSAASSVSSASSAAASPSASNSPADRVVVSGTLGAFAAAAVYFL